MSEDLIRRSDAIKAIEVVDWYHQNRNKDMVSGANSSEHQAWYKSQDIYEALENIPSADKPTVIRVKSIMKKEDYESLVDSIRQQALNVPVIVIPHNAELVPSADRPQGEWININTKLFRVQCSACKTWSDVVGNYCPWCGARMKGADDDRDSKGQMLRYRRYCSLLSKRMAVCDEDKE